MDTDSQHLDGEELFHLALAAGTEGQHEKAISLLKRAWIQDSRNPLILYCLGAEHAQIGMYERAMAEMERAIEMDPALDTARLQLGLLCMTCAQAERGEAALQALVDRDDDDCMGHFARGLIALARDELQACMLSLERGIALNTSNLPLNDDMRRLLQTVQAGAAEATTAQRAWAETAPVALVTNGAIAVQAAAPAAAPDRATTAEEQPRDNLWVSSYRKASGG